MRETEPERPLPSSVEAERSILGAKKIKMAETSTQKQVIEQGKALIKNLLGEGTIAVPRGLARLCGGTNAALMLSQAIYWAERTSNPNSWFWKTQREWEFETGLSRSEQQSARNCLISRGLIEERKYGLPAKLHFRVIWPHLIALLSGHGPSLSLAQIIEIHTSRLNKLSSSAYARAKKIAKRTGCRVESVKYREILIRDAGICYLCRKEITKGPGQSGEDLQFDHVVALVPKGDQPAGDHVEENIKAVHAGCNLNKAAQSAENQRTSLQNHCKQAPRKSADKSVGFQCAKYQETTAQTTPQTSPHMFPPGSEPRFALTPPDPKQVTVEPDSRFDLVKDAIRKCWPDVKHVPWNWTPRDDQSLRDLLQLSGWTGEQLLDCIAFRFLSENANTSQAPNRWLERVTEYAQGPLDRYNHLMPGGFDYWRSQARRIFYGEAVEQPSLELDAGRPFDRERALEWAEKNSRIYRHFCQDLQSIYTASIGGHAEPRAAVLKAAARAGVPDHIALELARQPGAGVRRANAGS